MSGRSEKPKLLFWGLMGYDRPSTRVRCVNFAKELRKYGYDCQYLLYRDVYGRRFGHEQMLHIGDRDKLAITLRAYWQHRNGSERVIYLQKAHWHAIAPYFLQKRRGFKMIFDYDDWDLDRSPFFNHKFLNSLVLGTQDEVVITWRLVDASIACVAASRGLEALLALRHPRVYYVPTGTDANLFSLTDEQRAARRDMDRTVFVWGGNVWGGIILGNVLFLLNCFAKLYEANPHVELRILAWGTYGDLVKSLISTNYANLPITFSSFIHPDKVPAFLASAHVGLLPLQGDDMNLEWLRNKSPTKQFEYMAMELATVATPVGDVRFLVKDGENGFWAETEDEFVEKMLLLANDRSLCEKIGKNARATILSGYCLERLGEKLAAMLEELKEKDLI